MSLILDQIITTALTASVSAPITLRDGSARSAVIQANFTYGSGGTTARVWVQTSVDGGATWIDVCDFSFTTSSARAVYNLSALTAVTTQYAATDGTLTANTAKDGVLGPLWRTKVTTTGTYAGGTTLRIDASFCGPLAVG